MSRAAVIYVKVKISPRGNLISSLGKEGDNSVATLKLYRVVSISRNYLTNARS
jgi:hypothetical protein